ncbi:MAG: ABC-ATPase domain-containing protein [Spirochaetota bacterium]
MHTSRLGDLTKYQNVHSSDHLKRTLMRIDSRGYKAYKDIRGKYHFGDYILFIDYVQGDPFASPSDIRVQVPQKRALFPRDTYSSQSREVALRNFLTRKFLDACRKYARGKRGSGKSGTITIDRPSQEILERTSAFITSEYVEARFIMGLPAFGRKVAGKHAQAMFFQELPRIVNDSLYFKNLHHKELYRHIETAEDADHLRNELEKQGLVGFVADGSILPRASGVDPRPLTRGKVVPFNSPDSYRVALTVPNRGKVSGMGIPEGVSLIVGGGYHGKSTLLNALELGIYNHIPGDGREFVVSSPHTIKIRAEDGRRIEKVDISPFISNLPFGKDTRAFSSPDASGSTSQSANIIEALEAGAKLLVMDEDTSATNFMIRDHRMQELVSKDKEPITPFIDKVRQLYRDLGVSTILAIGGSGDYFDVADNVVCLVEYRPYDMTDQARGIAEKYRSERRKEGGEHFGHITERVPLSGSFDPSKGKKEVKITSKGMQSIAFGTHRIDLGAVEQLVDISQTRTIGDAIYYATRYMDGKRTIGEIINQVAADLNQKGMDILGGRASGNYAMFRTLELACAINRLRTLSVLKKQ